MLQTQAPSELFEFIKYAFDAYNKFGATKLERAIKIAEELDDEQRIVVENKIIEEVCELYKVTPHDIKNTFKRGKVTDAKICAILLMHKHIPMKQAALAVYFSRDKALVSRLVRSYTKKIRKQKFMSDKMFEKKMRFLDSVITDFKNNLQ